MSKRLTVAELNLLTNKIYSNIQKEYDTQRNLKLIEASQKGLSKENKLIVKSFSDIRNIDIAIKELQIDRAKAYSKYMQLSKIGYFPNTSIDDEVKRLQLKEVGFNIPMNLHNEIKTELVISGIDDLGVTIEKITKEFLKKIK